MPRFAMPPVVLLAVLLLALLALGLAPSADAARNECRCLRRTVAAMHRPAMRHIMEMLFHHHHISPIT